MRPYAEYVAARDANRSHFAITYPYAPSAFDAAISAFSALGEQLRQGRDRRGKAHVSLAPLFFIFARQSVTAFDMLASNQAYAAWVTLRTGVESVLIMGKWVDDKCNAEIWERRFEDPRPYRREYQGPALRSHSLPRAADIQLSLSKINDRFLHPNPEYYFRHLTLEEQASGEVKMELSVFDDQRDVSLGVLGVLHLIVVLQDSLAGMFANLFVDTPRLDVHLTDLEEKGAAFRRSAGAESPEAEDLLVSIGLWPAAT